MASNINYRYFYFSPTAAAEITKIEREMNPDFSLPWVVANGIKKNYTDIVVDPSKIRYRDSILVAQGDMRRMNFSQLD